MIIKHLSMLGIMTTLMAVHMFPARPHAKEQLNPPAIGNTVVAPYVPIDVGLYYIQPTLCKISTPTDPVYMQLQLCKEQRKDWLKI